MEFTWNSSSVRYLNCVSMSVAGVLRASAISEKESALIHMVHRFAYRLPVGWDRPLTSASKGVHH
jgi:hypothetical protein